MPRWLVTGGAGFIGYHVSRKLCELGRSVLAVDNLTDYYSVQLKRDRLAQLANVPGFEFRELDLADRPSVADLFAAEPFAGIIHLAAQAGVRYSLQNPHAYVDSNLTAFVNVLEGARHARSPHLVYASSSSVYGSNRVTPYSVRQAVDHPISLYAATKKANELMAHTYSHLFGLPTTGLRFFTVYGPWGRPDMALYLFTEKILAGKPIDVFNYGRMRRDFTYIDDIVEGVIRVADRIPSPDPHWDDAADPGSSSAPYKVYNIGNHQPVELLRVIEILEQKLGRTAIRNEQPLQPGDVLETCADVDDLVRDVGFRPNTSIETGIARFVDWYRTYHSIS